MKRRDIHMHAVYVQGLNRIWADFMRRGQRRRVMASSRSPVDIVGAPHELIFLEEGHVRVYGMARQAPRLLLLMGPGCLVNTECLEGGQTSHGYMVRAMTPVTLLVRDVTAWYERRLACEYPELYVNVVQALAGINLLFLYRAHAVTFGPALSRLCALLLDIHDTKDCPVLRQKDMAELAGITPETASRLLARLALNELFCAITGEDIQKNKITTIVTPVLVPGELRNTNPASGHDGSGVFREFSTRDNR